VTPETRKLLERYLRAQPSATLHEGLDAFTAKSAHKSQKTRETVRERLLPFLDYLARAGVYDPLSITRAQVDGFLTEIAKGRRGKPLSQASMHGFTKDVKAFLTHVGDTLAPEDWRNPANKLRLSQPRTVIHPLSATQLQVLLGLADTAASPIIRARNRALLYVLIDGALRISEALGATKYQLGEDGILRVIGKGQKEREVALAPRTFEAIAEYMLLRSDRSPMLIVTEHGQPLKYSGAKMLFRRWREAAPEAFRGVRLSAHTLRHTSATMRRIAGMSEGDLQTFLGHATPAMTRHYSAFALSRAANTAARRTSPIESLS
jgi:site-specific recombinase XerD